LFFPFFLFVLLLWVFYFYFYLYCLFFLSILSTLPSSSSHPSSHPLHSPSLYCAKIHCSPSKLLIPPLHTHSLPLSLPSPSILPQTVKRLPLPPIHSPPADQPTIPTLHNPNSCNPWHKHPIPQQQKYTQTYTRAIKTSSHYTTFPTHLPHFHPPLLVPPYPMPQTSIASLTNVNFSNSHCL
jgi:hypothetical protein